MKRVQTLDFAPEGEQNWFERPEHSTINSPKVHQHQLRQKQGLQQHTPVHKTNFPGGIVEGMPRIRNKTR